jgi:hypothetical protein
MELRPNNLELLIILFKLKLYYNVNLGIQFKTINFSLRFQVCGNQPSKHCFSHGVGDRKNKI